MPETSNRILQVDATIELKDYFQAYFDAAKTKLIIATLIVASVIAGFTYFFVLIGEQAILWQLSPLFFGVPIVAIVGQFLRVHASYRKYIKGLSESEKNVHYIFREDAEGFDVVYGKSFSHIAWENVRHVSERPQYFQFALDQYSAILIPKRYFLTAADQELLKEIILANVGSKAKLLK